MARMICPIMAGDLVDRDKDSLFVIKHKADVIDCIYGAYVFKIADTQEWYGELKECSICKSCPSCGGKMFNERS